MSAGRRRTTPALIQRGQWLTVPDCKRVLFVVHTVTYGKRLRDVFSLLESDFRIQVLFTVAPHAFGQGVHQYLRNLGITVIPWKEAVRTEFDLAVAAGSQGTDEIRAPLIRLPHGAGHIKLRRAGDEESADGPRVPGMLSREHLVRNGRVVPAALVLSHEQHLAALARSCPEALPVASVVGDPCHDRIVASVSRRAAYRRALGLDDERPLVLITSTWGRTAAFGRFDALLPRLVNELPERFRTAVLVHPNVWAGHSGWQVRAWLGACRRRGVVLLPPDTDFEALLIAADWIIGDHGSVTVYGSLTGVPILLARSPDGTVAADSPAVALAARAPALCPFHPLLDQLRYAAERYRPEQYESIATLLSSAPGAFNRRMRALMYRLLRLGEPAYSPVVEPFPPPSPPPGWNEPGAEAAA